MKSYNDEKILLPLLFLGIVAGFFGAHIESIKDSIAKNGNLNQAAAILAVQQNLVPTNPVLPTLTLGFTGDIMLDRSVKKSVVSHFGGDYSKLFANAGFLKEPDIMFANLEGDVSDKGQDLHNLYSFRMDPKVLPVLKDAGIDIVSFANNHIWDWGQAAFEDSLSRIRASGILVCGAGMNKAEASQPAIIEQNGTRIGYLCFSDVGPEAARATSTHSGILLADDADFNTIVKNASQKVDTLIVSFHFGVEYKTNAHTARQEALAKRAIDNGAALIVGAHPHVPEDIATYNGATILYSLGNFIFDQSFSKETMGGLYVTAKLSNKKISDIVPHKTVLDSNYAVSLEK